MRNDDGSRATLLTPPRAVVLVGPMGSGKSTVARALGARLGLPTADTDEIFAQLHGPIPTFFSAHGEPAFREAEAEVVQAALSHPHPRVLSLGGGAVISATTRSALREGPWVVQLDVDEAEALTRLGGGQGRPVLAGDPARTWRRIRSEREHLYREVATWTVTTTGRSADQVAARIAALLAEQLSRTEPADLDRQSPTDQHSGDAR